MSRGTSLTLKCHRCKRGMWGEGLSGRGCRPTGRVEERVTRSKHSGGGGGGRGFLGHRGEVECLDCGHRWWSTHPRSGRKEFRSTNPEIELPK